MRDSAEILTDQPPPAADARIAYGPEPLQFGDLRVPPGDGPFPLALVLHGGYWQAIYNLIHLGHLCEALRDAGIASWNLVSRSVGDPGGEWPAAAEDLEPIWRTPSACRLPPTVAASSSRTRQAAGSRSGRRSGAAAGGRAGAVCNVRDAVDRRGSAGRPAATWRRALRDGSPVSCSFSACRRS